MTQDVLTAERAVWTTAFVNDLSDASFLYIEAGGSKDAEGKTTPRSLRYFPVRDADGAIDLPHLRNAIARIPQSNADGLTPEKKQALQDRARKMLANEQGSGAKAGKRMAGAIVDRLAGAIDALSSLMDWAKYEDTQDGGDQGMDTGMMKATMDTCPECGASAPAGTKTCPDCGASMMGAMSKELSYEQRRSLLSAQLTRMYPSDLNTANAVGVGTPWVRDLYTDKVVYDLNSHCYEAPYAIAADGSILLGTPVEVVQTFVPLDVVKVHSGSFTVIKAADGTDRWIAVSSNGFQDREGEIVSTEALKACVDHNDQKVIKDFGPLRLFHVAGADIGTCDYQAVHERFLIESGTFDATPEAQHAKTYFTENADQLGISIGFKYPLGTFEGKVYKQINILERSVCPVKAVANPWTAFHPVQKEESMDKEKQAFLEAALTPAGAQKLLERFSAMSKELESTVAYKTAQAQELPLKDRLLSLVERVGDEMLKTEMKALAETIEVPATKDGEPEASGDPDKFISGLVEAVGAAIAPLATQMAEVNKAVADLGTRIDGIETATKTLEAGYKTAPRAAAFIASRDGASPSGDALKELEPATGANNHIAPYINDILQAAGVRS